MKTVKDTSVTEDTLRQSGTYLRSKYTLRLGKTCETYLFPRLLRYQGDGIAIVWGQRMLTIRRPLGERIIPTITFDIDINHTGEQYFCHKEVKSAGGVLTTVFHCTDDEEELTALMAHSLKALVTPCNDTKILLNCTKIYNDKETEV